MNARVDSETIAAIPEVVSALRQTFNSERTRSAEWRIAQLDGIQRFLSERAAEIEAALKADLGKSHLEAYLTETNFTAGEIRHAKRHLSRWMAPQRVPAAMVVEPASARIYKDPLGVVLIIAPWNYPLQLLLGPLVAAVAAGNCAVLKPSEVSAHTSAMIARWLPEYVDRDCIRVVEGGVPETTALLDQRFDHIFYTGNGTVARIVMAAAVKHLTPVTLELGGKSPCIVDETADLAVAARRICWAKFTNAGQTCVAPDYILVKRSVHDALVAKLGATLRDFFGEDAQKSGDYGRIISPRHHHRLVKLMEGATVAHGGRHDAADRYIEPTILTDVSPDAPIMQEEIFGPLLPVLAVDDIETAIRFINGRDKPLALYVFSSDKDTQEAVLTRTSSGGAVVNHAVVHLACPSLPFGGVGESGMGAYHGQHGFDLFTHHKSVLKKPNMIDPPLLYPPYDRKKIKWIKRLA
jgi:aldehyde dehydrogenase (NAD+)